MEKIKKLLTERREYLLNLKQEKENALLNMPEGTLRISGTGKKVQYYQRMNSKNKNGTYIKGKETSLIQSLAQKDYDKKIFQACEKELKAIEKYFTLCPHSAPEHIYEKLFQERKKLVIPIRETDEEFIRKWEAEDYPRKGFSENIPEYFTSKGERVRSKSEVIIADFLARENIPYRYEWPVQLKGAGIYHPDFTLLNVKERKEIFLEHLGRMDDPEYIENAMQRITNYEKNGYFPGENLILTHETKSNPLNQKVLQRVIGHYIS